MTKRFLFSDDLQFWRVDGFDEWRIIARHLFQQGIAPEQVSWLVDNQGQSSLAEVKTIDSLAQEKSGELPSRQSDAKTVAKERNKLVVPPTFIELAEYVACHRDPARFSLLYQAVWRMGHGERHLLELATDELTAKLLRMQKQLSRDCHKMKAFVRFKLVADQPEETYIAWHQPDHNIVRLVAPFFSRRFKGMHWTILTPGGSATWDGQHLTYGPGVPLSAVPGDDELVSLWRDYYRATFNPARIKVKAMKKEMPVRYWKNLPETSEIESLLAEAPSRVEEMVTRAQRLHRADEASLPAAFTRDELSSAILQCRSCDLCENGTRPVVGAGPANARLMIVGEQPGDREEKIGQPFVGPAGQLLDELLAEVGLDREQVYLTNVVKHFHHEARGKQRLHKRPSARHEAACSPWLHREVTLVRPQVVLALGVVAMNALVGRQHKITHLLSRPDQTESFGGPLASWASPQTFVAWHPAAILRVEQKLAVQRRIGLLQILKKVKTALTNLEG